MRVEYSHKFTKNALCLPAKVIALAEEKEALFTVLPFHPSLKTHKLNGENKGKWAFSVTQKYRITFVFLADGGVIFQNIGTHDEVYR